MRAAIIGFVLTLGMGGLALSQTERHAVPTDECTPGSMQVILGLCTESQRQEAKTLNTDRAATRPAVQQPVKTETASKSAKPAVLRGGATVSVHFSADEVAAIDAWIAQQPDHGTINRADAVHRLLDAALPASRPAE